MSVAPEHVFRSSERLRIEQQLRPAPRVLATSCFSGKYLKQEACKTCPKGFYKQGSNAQQYCNACDEGRYQTLTGKSYCPGCPKGYSNAYTGKSMCGKCPVARQTFAEPSVSHVGGFSFLLSVLIDSLWQGYFQDEYSQPACDACDKGRYQISTGKSSCPGCPTGYSNAYTGKSMCGKCPVARQAFAEPYWFRT